MDLVAHVEAGGLVARGRPVVVLLSGGRDSTCLLDVCVQLGAQASALHVNYGLREEAGAEEEHCRGLCRRLEVELDVEHPGRVEGNTQAWARDVRYAAGARLAEARGADLAAAHTASDQVETVLYRLASSPGRRALLGMRPRRDRIVRPLLEVTREEAHAYCQANGLAWREDESNRDRGLARNLLRLEVIPLLREVHPAVERNVLSTAAVLRDEHEVLDQAVDDAIRASGAGGRPPAVELARLAQLAPAVRRLVLTRLAEDAGGASVPIGREDASAIERLGAAGGSGSVP